MLVAGLEVGSKAASNSRGTMKGGQDVTDDQGRHRIWIADRVRKRNNTTIHDEKRHQNNRGLCSYVDKASDFLNDTYWLQIRQTSSTGKTRRVNAWSTGTRILAWLLGDSKTRKQASYPALGFSDYCHLL